MERFFITSTITVSIVIKVVALTFMRLKIVQCFLNHIGLNYCTPEGLYDSPASGLYLNSLPGISIKNIDQIADSEQITYIGVWDDLQRFALAQFRMDILAKLRECFKLNRDCDYDTLICENIDELTVAWHYLLGWALMIFRITSERINRWTTIGLDEARELRDFYQLEYQKALQQGVLLMDTSECCLQCEPNPATVVWLP